MLGIIPLMVVLVIETIIIIFFGGGGILCITTWSLHLNSTWVPISPLGDKANSQPGLTNSQDC